MMHKRALGFLLLAAAIVGDDSPADAASLRVRADNSLSNNASVGAVIDPSPDRSRIGITNSHSFWTNVVLSPRASGNVTLMPSDPLRGGDLGGIYAAIGAIAPYDRAVWDGTFESVPGASRQFITDPSVHTGSVAPPLTVVSIIWTMLGANPTPKDAAAVFEGLRLLNSIPDFVAMVHAFDDQDPAGFATSFYELVSDHTKAEQLSLALRKFGVPVASSAIKQLTRGVTILQLTNIVVDQAAAIIQQTSAGRVSFQTAEVPTIPPADLSNSGLALPAPVGAGELAPSAPVSPPAVPTTELDRLNAAVSRWVNGGPVRRVNEHVVDSWCPKECAYGPYDLDSVNRGYARFASSHGSGPGDTWRTSGEVFFGRFESGEWEVYGIQQQQYYPATLPGPALVCAAGGLNVREQPSVSARSVGYGSSGPPVTLERFLLTQPGPHQGDGWFQISSPRSGWISARFVFPAVWGKC